MTDFKPGDPVYIGKPGRGKIHWDVLLVTDGWAALESPMSSRLRYEPVTNLTHHAPKEPSQ